MLYHGTSGAIIDMSTHCIVNFYLQKGWTPLHSAAQNGKSEANINATTVVGI